MDDTLIFIVPRAAGFALALAVILSRLLPWSVAVLFFISLVFFSLPAIPDSEQLSLLLDSVLTLPFAKIVVELSGGVLLGILCFSVFLLAYLFLSFLTSSLRLSPEVSPFAERSSLDTLRACLLGFAFLELLRTATGSSYFTSYLAVLLKPLSGQEVIGGLTMQASVAFLGSVFAAAVGLGCIFFVFLFLFDILVGVFTRLGLAFVGSELGLALKITVVLSVFSASLTAYLALLSTLLQKSLSG